MGVLSLKVRIAERGIVKTMQFDPSTLVYDACKIIREKIPEATAGAQHKDFGLFLSDEDPKKGVWMENGRTLEYYLVRSGDLLEYKKKIRTLRVRMLDGAVKTLLVDDSQPVGQLMVVICTRIGITNYEEYSMVREGAVEKDERTTGTLPKKEDKLGTLTLTRNKEKKMDQLRAKLHTDEELNWIDQSKTLREQGVEENETLLLRRKFFFSDTNVDARDPVQLNLLYVQCRDGIIDGSHPVSKEEAIHLAGLQCQIQFGDFQETKQRASFLDLREFLPKEYIKGKDAEKRIMQVYRECKGLNELDAKVRYVSRCRSLKTYGVTFFLVKEKLKGKNKLVPRLLGINKESVMRVDERTKDVIKEWPLEQVRRWAASPNTFTLDFGDYQDAYYSVQTLDGEKIAQLIAGYIDIILKKKKAKDHFGIEGDEGSTMLEDLVSPAKAMLMSHGQIRQGYADESNVAMPGVYRSSMNGEVPFGTGSMQKAQYGAIGGQVVSAHPPPSAKGQKPKVVDTLSRSQRALVGTIEASVKAVERAEEQLDQKADLPVLGEDAASRRWKEEEMEVQKQNVEDQIAAMSAATAEAVQLTGAVPDEVDHTRVGAAVSTISSNLPEMTKGVRTIAALMDEDERGDQLLEATRKLCGAFSDFLTAVNPEHKETRQTVLAAASRVGDFSHQVIETVEEPSEESKEFQDILVQLAKAVATSTAHLVLKAKTISGECEEQQLQDKVIHSATQCAFATSQLVACARVVAPTIDSAACQEQLTDAAKQVAKAVENLLKDAELACHKEKPLGDLRDAAAQVSRALDALLGHIKVGPRARITEQEQEVETIIHTTDRIITHTGSSNEMVRQAKVLAEATTHLVQQIRGEADVQETEDNRDKLLSAARRLADATTAMIDAAKGCAMAPQDAAQQSELITRVKDVQNVTASAGERQLKHSALIRLENAARDAAASATQTIAAAKTCEPSNRNAQTQAVLEQQCTETAQWVPPVIRSIKHHQTAQEPKDVLLAQTDLVRSCQQVLDPWTRLMNAGRGVAPSVSDQAAALQLTTSTQRLSESLAELRTSLTRAQEVCASMELDYAVEVVRTLDDELAEYGESAARGGLYPLPGESAETSATQLNSSTRVVGSALAQMLSAAVRADEQYVGVSARDAAEGLRQLGAGIHGVAATNADAPADRLIGSGRNVMGDSLLLFEEVKICLQQPSQPERQERLAVAARAVSNSLKQCLACLPGQQDLDAAITTITTISRSISSTQIPPSARGYQEVQEDLLRCAAQLSEATNQLAADTTAPLPTLQNSVNRYVTCYKHFVTVSLEMTYHQQDTERRERMLDCLRNLSMESGHYLMSVKSCVAEPNAPNLKQQLTTSSKVVVENINMLIDICMSGSPAQNECDNALRRIEAARRLFDECHLPLNGLTYFECVDAVTEQSKRLGDGMTGIAQHAKTARMDAFCGSVRDSAAAVCGLADGAAQAAYLVGVSDAASTPGRAGLVDAATFSRSVQLVREACSRVRQGRFTQRQILDDATAIAKHTSTLANMCRDASGRTNNEAAKRHLISCARGIAKSTADIIQAVRQLDQESFNEANKRECAVAAESLLAPLDSLSTFVNSPEFAGQPAKLSAAGRRAQEPILLAGRQMLSGSCDMITTAKCLAVNPKDPPTWQQLADNSRSVSDSIKRLITAIRERAPGQAECDAAIERMLALIRMLDHTSLAAINQSLPPRNDNNEQGFHQQVSSSATNIHEKIEAVRQKSKYEAERLGCEVTEMTAAFDPLVDGSIGAASLSYNSKQQMLLLDQCKTITECELQLLYAAKDSGGNPKATEYHRAVDEQCAALREALAELLQVVQAAASEAGVVSGMVESISSAIARTDERPAGATGEAGSFVDCQTRMVRACHEISRVAQEMVAKSYADPNALGPLALELSRNYAQLADDSRWASALVSDADVATRIRCSVQDLGTACIELVKRAGSCRAHPGDQFTKRDLAEAARTTSEKVQLVLAALQSGMRGTQACINAASTVSGIIGDLNTTIMFATAGTLNPEQSGDNFSDHREAILKTAKALVEDTKALVSGAASSQEQLAVAAQNAVRTIVNLSDVVKSGAAALTSQNSEAQVLVIHAVKDVAAALSNLIQATKNASGRNLNDPAMTNLKEAAKVMVTNVTSLLKTVKTVEDEHQRGTRALESAIEAIAQEIRAYDSTEPPARTSKPEELLRVSKPVTDATARAVAAGQSCQQDDAIAAANLARKAVFDLLKITKATAFGAESADARYRALDAGRDVAIKVNESLPSLSYGGWMQVRELLQGLHVVLQRPGSEGRDVLVVASRSIAQAVTDLVSFGEILKGSDWVDPADPTVIAENELLGAANSIEAAARKLELLKPRHGAKPADESLNFDAQILQAAKSIAAAVQALVKAASSAQRELVAQGRIEAHPSMQHEDYQWSEGLISAARMVAAAVHSLCEAANALVQGHASEERLISAAKQVAASTAQLLVACKVKADINSKSMQRLQAAGHAVKTATEHLVRAARQSIEAEDERTLVISQRMVSGIAQVMDAQEQVLRKERELNEARVTLSAIRKAKYKDHPAGSHEASPDAPYYSDY